MSLLESTRFTAANLPMDSVMSILGTPFELNVRMVDVMEHPASVIPRQWESIVVLEEVLVQGALNFALLPCRLGKQLTSLSSVRKTAR
jgi:hypothetical protein